MNKNFETVVGFVAVGHRVRELAFEQRRGVEDNFARIPHRRTIGQNLLQLPPADARTVTRADLFALRGDVRVQRLPEIVSRELLRHASLSEFRRPTRLRSRGSAGPAESESTCAGRSYRRGTQMPRCQGTPAFR